MARKRLTTSPPPETQRRSILNAIYGLRANHPDRWPTIEEIAEKTQLGDAQVRGAVRFMGRGGVLIYKDVGNRREWLPRAEA